MHVTVLVDLIKGGAPAWPRIEHDDALVVVGSARPLEDAWRISLVEMGRWFGELYGLDVMDGYQLLSQISLAPVANVVDANYSAVTKVAKSLLPPTRAYGGIHDRMAEAAAGL
jgi:acetamidase/formamidase